MAATLALHILESCCRSGERSGSRPGGRSPPATWAPPTTSRPFSSPARKHPPGAPDLPAHGTTPPATLRGRVHGGSRSAPRPAPRAPPHRIGEGPAPGLDLRDAPISIRKSSCSPKARMAASSRCPHPPSRGSRGEPHPPRVGAGHRGPETARCDLPCSHTGPRPLSFGPHGPLVASLN